MSEGSRAPLWPWLHEPLQAALQQLGYNSETEKSEADASLFYVRSTF